MPEQLQTPAWATSALARAGGLNPFGQPMFVLSWGWSRLSPIGGHWDDNGAFEVRMVPKYMSKDEHGNLTFNRWHIEKWLPAEMYGSPEDWDARTIEWENEAEKTGRSLQSLGPYPSRGEYELCLTLAGKRGEFMAPTIVILETCVQLIEAGRLEPKSKRKAALYEREAKRERDEIARNEDILGDVSPYFKGSYVVVPDTGDAFKVSDRRRLNGEQR